MWRFLYVYSLIELKPAFTDHSHHFHNDFVGGQFAAEVSESPIEEHAYSVRAWMHAEMKTMSVYKYVLLQAHIIYLHSSRRGGDLFS